MLFDLLEEQFDLPSGFVKKRNSESRKGKIRIILQGDSGFAREELMGWCEVNHVDYIFGLARNSRFVGEIKAEMEEAQRLYGVYSK